MIYVADMYVASFVKALVNPFVPLLFKDGDVKFYSPREILMNFARYGFIEIDVKKTDNLQIVTMRKS